MGQDGKISYMDLPGGVYQQSLKDIIKAKFNVPLEACKIVIDAGSAKGDNYLGVLYRVNIRPPKGKELNVIIKLPPTSVARREQFFARPSFLRESKFYESIYPMFKKFQEEKGIDVEKDGFHEVAACYKSLTEDMLEGLFLEDLKATGFEMFDRFKDVTVDHVYRVMECLGKLHALSFAIKDQKPELIAPFQEMKDIFLERDDAFKEQMKTWFECLEKQALDTINDSSNQDLKQKVHKVLEESLFEMLEATVDPIAAEPYSVICHGDCWNNNIMYRYENGIPEQVRLLDWQIMRYASPVCDLLYYIFGCTTKSLRDKHYNDFLDVYYKSFSSFLIRLGSNPSKLFPRQVIDEHLRRFAKFGIAMTVLILPLITSKPEDTLDMEEVARKFKEAADCGTVVDAEVIRSTNPRPNDIYTKRMRDVFEDMYNMKYI